MPDHVIIPEFSPPWECFSNFHPSVLIISGKIYPTVEHAYQASKALSEAEHEWVRTALDARTAKKRGRRVQLRPNFDNMRIPLMRLFVTMKFTMYTDYRQTLIGSGNAIIQEGNWWNDTFWGICRGVGENHLGLLLMEVRDLMLLLP